MAHVRTWTPYRYSQELRRHSDVELDAAELLVADLNARNNLALALFSRPDRAERNKTAADFVYRDRRRRLEIAIEVKALFLQQKRSRRHCLAVFANDVEACLESAMGCVVLIEESWKPPKKTGQEAAQRRALCRMIAGALEDETKRREQAVVANPALKGSVGKVDLSHLVTDARQATAIVFSYGSGGHVEFYAVPEGVSYEDVVSAEHARRLRHADGQLSTHRRSGRETFLLLDGRLGNQLFPNGLEQVCEWHAHAADAHAALRRLSPLKRSDFAQIQHIVALETDEHGVKATTVWRAPDARLTLPGGDWTVTPPGCQLAD